MAFSSLSNAAFDFTLFIFLNANHPTYHTIIHSKWHHIAFKVSSYHSFEKNATVNLYFHCSFVLLRKSEKVSEGWIFSLPAWKFIEFNKKILKSSSVLFIVCNDVRWGGGGGGGKSSARDPKPPPPKKKKKKKKNYQPLLRVKFGRIPWWAPLFPTHTLPDSRVYPTDRPKYPTLS